MKKKKIILTGAAVAACEEVICMGMEEGDVQ